MTQFRLPILNWSTRPDDSGDSYFEPYDILATNDIVRRMILRMGRNNAAEPSVKSGVYGSFVVPRNYLQTPDPVVIVDWTSTVSSGNVVFQFEFAIAAGDDAGLDPAGWSSVYRVTQNVGGANWRKTAGIAISPGNWFSVDTLVNFYFTRLGTDAADNKPGSALVFDLAFQYEGT